MAEKHFIEQKQHAHTYLIPFFKKHIPCFEESTVLEIGCAEGGFLDELWCLGMDVAGVELSIDRVRLAKQKNPKLRILVGDITDPAIVKTIRRTFDLIVMRDVIEHIPDKTAAFSNIDQLLNKNGNLYISFPPKFSPFGGHQQIGQSALKYVPYLQLLPQGVIRVLGRLFRERLYVIENTIENFKLGLSIRSFENFCTKFHYKPVVKDLFILRPVYQTRFGIQSRTIPGIPVLREFMTFGCECLLQKTM